MSQWIQFLICMALSASAAAETLRIEPKHATFEPAITSSMVHHAYTISNTGSSRIAIREWKAISGFGEVKGLPETLAPGESRSFDVDLRLPGSLGESLFRFALFSDETDVDRYRFTLAGFVYSLISPEKPLIDFGQRAVPPGATQELALSAREKTDLELVRIDAKPEWLDIDLDQSTVRARIRNTPPFGLKAGTVRIATSLARQPFVEISVKAIVGGALQPSVYALGFRPTEVGETVTAGIELKHPGKSALDKLEIELPDTWKAARSKCDSTSPAGGSCIRITLSHTMETAGRNAGVMRFRLPGEPELSIPFGIMGLGKSQTVRELLLSEEPGETLQESIDITKLLHEGTAGTEKTVSESSASAAPTKSANIARASGAGPVHLHWQARNDSKIFGYMIYRSVDRAGPFVRISDRPVPGAKASPSDVSTYDFTDNDVSAGSTYYYYIDALGEDGLQVRLSPVLSKSVKAAD